MLYTILSRRAALALALAGGNIAGCSGSVAAGSHICHLGSNLADRRQSYKVVEAEPFSLTPVVPCFSLAQGVLISYFQRVTLLKVRHTVTNVAINSILTTKLAKQCVPSGDKSTYRR